MSAEQSSKTCRNDAHLSTALLSRSKMEVEVEEEDSNFLIYSPSLSRSVGGSEQLLKYGAFKFDAGGG